MKISPDFGVLDGCDKARNGSGSVDKCLVPSETGQLSMASSLARDARQVFVSEEFVCILGGSSFAWAPPDALIISFANDQCCTKTDVESIIAANHRACGITFALSRSACARLFGSLPPLDARWHMPGQLRALGQSLMAITNDDEASYMLRAARSIELLCSFFSALSDDRLVPANGSTTLREQEIALVVAAHKIVNEDWREPLTVCSIARRCGMSRSKLTRGYREIYRSTIGEAVSKRRLDDALRLLAQSDLHISTVGYRCGYTNNASFSRAFARRFGMTPTEMRRRQRDVGESMLAHAHDRGPQRDDGDHSCRIRTSRPAQLAGRGTISARTATGSFRQWPIGEAPIAMQPSPP